MTKKIVILMLIASLAIFTSGCFNQNSEYKEHIDAKEVRQLDNMIFVTIVDIKQLPEGTDYSLKLKNGSPYLIKQNTVYLSYPKLKPWKIEATGNKLDIKPNDEVLLAVFTPTELPKNNNLSDPKLTSIMIRGYLNEVKEINHFDIGWSF